MITVDWKNEFEKRLIHKGLSLNSEEDILLKNKEFFNDILREIISLYPEKPIFNIIMSLRENYDTSWIATVLLDKYNLTLLKEQTAKELGVRKKSDKKYIKDILS